MNREVFAAVADALDRGEPAALVTIVSTTGSTPQRIGAKMLVFADGRIVGTIGGGCYENDAFWKAREAITNRKPKVVHYELSDDFAQETGLICGGQMDVYIEPIEPSPELFVVGAGHVGFHLATLAQDTDVPDIHTAFQMCLPFYAAYLCDYKLGNDKKSEIHLQAFKRHMDALKGKLQKFSDDLLRFRWGWTYPERNQ